MNEKAVFGAGCFWGVEEIFRKVKGVLKTKVGFMGGKLENPTYEEVCEGGTGHVEVCYLEFDSEKVSYEELLEIFWNIHDPTQMNRQGLDVGEQYKSIIFYYNEKQKKKAVESMNKEQKKYKKKIVTEIVPLGKFYEAEEYHQEYLMKKGKNVC